MAAYGASVSLDSGFLVSGSCMCSYELVVFDSKLSLRLAKQKLGHKA